MPNPKFLLLLILIPLLNACQKDATIKQQDSINVTNWQLDVAESQFSFVTVKNKTHTEEHTIDYADGKIDDKGTMALSIDLSSVNTLIERRDERMRDILFEVKKHPTASINTTLTHNLPLDKPIAVEFVLNLHGVSKNMESLVMIQKVDKKMVVINYEPILVNAKDFNLDNGINELTKIAGLQSINYEVLVDFKLVFEK